MTPQSGRPKVDAIHRMVLDDWFITVRQMPKTIGIGIESVNIVLHVIFGRTKLSARRFKLKVWAQAEKNWHFQDTSELDANP